MGYRSDITILFTGKDEQSIKDFVTCHELTASEDSKSMIDIQEIIGCRWIIKFNDIKWYDQFPEVKYWIALTESCSAIEQNKVTAEIVRLGEHEEDTEHQTYGTDHFYLYVSRSVELCDE